MDNAIFLSKTNIFSGDCGGEVHNSANEPASCPHYHDFYEFFVYLGNKGTFMIDGKEHSIRRGDIVIVDMFLPHMLIPGASQDECFVAHVNPELLITYSTHNSNLLDIFHKGYFPVHSTGEKEFPKYQRLLDEYRAVRLNSGQDILIKAIIHQLMAYAYGDCFSGIRCDSSASRGLTIVTQIINYINEHLAEKISLSTLAKEINYSECYLCHLFKEATNKTISSYIQEKRIDMATGLLKRSVSIKKVAEQSGFGNYSHFYKTFKRHIGCNPEEYRERLQVAAKA